MVYHLGCGQDAHRAGPIGVGVGRQEPRAKFFNNLGRYCGRKPTSLRPCSAHHEGIVMSTNYSIVSHGEQFNFDDSNWSKEFADYLINQALKVILDRSSASKTKKDGHSDQDRLAECRKVAERLAKGELPARGGFGKTKLSDEDFAMRAALNTKLKALKGEGVEAQLERYTQELAKAQGKEFKAAMVAKVKKAVQASEVYKTSLAARKATKGDDDLAVGL